MQRVAVVLNQSEHKLVREVLAEEGLAAVEESSAVEFAIVDEERLGEVPPALRWIGIGKRGARMRLMAIGATCVLEMPIAADDLVRAIRWVRDVYCS